MSTAGKPIECRAAVLWKVNTPYSIEKVVVDIPKKGEVRIKMTSTGLCHSDTHFQEGSDPDYIFPGVLGHEGAGLIESVGEGVTSVAPGDLVVLVFHAHCGKCDLCINPNTNMCLVQKDLTPAQFDGTTRITCNGTSLSQMSSLGTFSEYTVTSELNVSKVNPRGNPQQLCLVGCCVPTGYGAVMNAARVKKGASCAIWGLGGVGMCVVMGCRDSGAGKIIGIDVNPGKFELAKELGCTDVLNPKDLSKSVPEVLAEMTNGGVDYCFVSVGIIPVMEQAFESSHPFWGETIVIGLADMGEKMKVGVWDLLWGRKLKGTFYGSYKAKVAIPGLVEKTISGQIPLNKLITHSLPLSRINEGFNMLKTGESLRAVVDFSL